jgi:putative ABC transport system ATP-binding protein
MTSGIDLQGISRSFRSRSETVHAVVDVTASFPAGSTTAIVGPSGSGKTSLINLIVGWDQPDAGSIERPAEHRDDWSGIAVVPQSLGLLDDLSVRDNIALPLRFGNDARFDVDELIEFFGLGEVAARLPAETSLGEQQRTAVARAVVCRSAVLVADEPTAHQDEANAVKIMDALLRAAAAGACVLVATHEERLLHLVDRVLTMVDGRAAFA